MFEHPLTIKMLASNRPAHQMAGWRRDGRPLSCEPPSEAFSIQVFDFLPQIEARCLIVPSRRCGRPRSTHLLCLRDRNGRELAYIYYENEPGRRSAAKLLSKDEARWIAANFAKLTELVGKT